MRTAQEIYDIVVQRLRAQGSRSLSEEGDVCRYRGADNKRCAIGHLIPDNVYRKDIEGFILPALLNKVSLSSLLPVDLKEEFDKYFRLLHQLQITHDLVKDPKEWEDRFQTIAQEFGLIYTPTYTL